MIKINKKVTFLVLLTLTVLLATTVVSAADSNSTTDTSTSTSIDDNSVSISETSNSNSDTNEVKSTSDTSSSTTQEVKTIDNDAKTTTNTDDKQKSTSAGSNQEVKSQESTQSSQSNSVKNSTVDREKQLTQEESNSNNQTTTSQNNENIEEISESNSIDQSQLVNTTKELKTAKKETDTYSYDQEVVIDDYSTIYAYIQSIDGTVPTGNITAVIDGTTLSAPITYSTIFCGTAKFTYRFTEYGTYTVKISYSGNSNYQASSGTFKVTVSLPVHTTVNNYTELYNRVERIKAINSTKDYIIDLNDGDYKITKTIYWGSTNGVKNLEIRGSHVKNYTYIYGSGKNQFLNIASGYNVTLERITFMNGYASNGGTIYNNGNLEIGYSTFNNSKATNGGAIYNTGTLYIYYTEFNNCQATQYGGALYTSSSASTRMKTTNFTNNIAVSGGAIYNNGYSTNINSTIFKYNRATNGGAIYNKNNIYLTQGSMSYNSAESGGALYNSGSSANMTLNDNMNLYYNNALYGGGIFNYNNAYLNVRLCIFNYQQAQNGEVLRNKNATAIMDNVFTNYTSEDENNIFVTTNGKTTLTYTTAFRSQPIEVKLNMASLMVVTGNSGRITGNITDSNNKLINQTVTITISVNNNVLDTSKIYNGIIDINLNFGSLSSGVYNITTTLKGDENYLTTNATTVLMKNKAHSIVVTSATGKNNEKVTLTAYITDKNGNRATSGTATFKLNDVTIKENGSPIKVNIKNGVATYTYTIPSGYSAKDYKLTAVADVNGRIENTAKLKIEKTDQVLSGSTSMFVTGNTAQLTGTIVDANGKITTRDTKVAIKINGKTLINTVVTNGKLNVTLDLSAYKSGAYTIEIILGENGCYNTGYANVTLIKNLKNSVVIMPTNATLGSTSTLTAFVTDSNGNRQSSGTVTFKIGSTTVGTSKISNGVANITYETLLYHQGNYNLTATTTVNGKTLTNSTTLRIRS